MSRYKVGDVAALFSKPKEPTTESGKKLQSLFKEFHGKNKRGKSSSQITEKVVNNFNQGSEKAQNQRVSKNGKRRKFSAVTSEESDEVNNTNKFKKIKKEDANCTELKKKHTPAEQDFPRKKKSKTNKSNLKNNGFNSFEGDETALSDDIKNISDGNFKSKNKSIDKKEISKFIKKLKQGSEAAMNGTIKFSDNGMMSDEDKYGNSILFKEDCVESVEQSSKKQKKKRHSKDNFVQNKKTNYTGGTDNLENKTLFKKSYGGNKQNSQPKFSEKGEPDFIKVPDIKFEDEEEQSAKKQKKKSHGNDNFVQNKKPNHTSGTDNLENKTLYKKSYGGNKQNSQPKFSEKGEPDFIKVPDLKSEDEEEILSRTLFIGNLPVNLHIKAIKNLFSPFGEIQDVRYKGFETDKAKIFNENHFQTLNARNYAADSVPGFVVFYDRQSAVKALSLSGSLFKGRHITVDFAVPAGTKKIYDDKRSIFIGNLPFDCKDESVWEAFSECGRIENVRIVRDKKTGIGKGFGYVQFSTVQAKENALGLDDLTIQGRNVRVKPIESNRANLKKAKNPPPVKIDSFKSRAIKIKAKNKDSTSRKSVKKIMKKQKNLHKKKKVANILQKSMKI